jgi:hypothetical protein
MIPISVPGPPEGAGSPVLKGGPRAPKHSVAFLTPVLDTMVRIRKRRKSGVFVITAPHSGAGTSYVVNLLAMELTNEFGNCVMVSSSTSADGSPVAKNPAYVEQAPNVWVPVRDQDVDKLPENELDRVVVGMKPETFDFVLLDAPPLASGRRALRLGQAAEGAFLVVDAGRTKREEIEQAQRYFASSATRLLGVILNRRTYAIPEAIYKIL